MPSLLNLLRCIRVDTNYLNMEINETGNLTQLTYTATIVNLTVGIAAFLINLSVCIIISTNPTLRQPFNHLILNLSFSDLLVSLAVVVNGILDYFSITRFMTYSIASTICKIGTLCAVISLPGACLTLLMMSIERYQAIASIQLRKIKLESIRKIVILIWFMATLSAIIPFIYARLDPFYPNECFVGRINNFALLIICIIGFSITCIISIAIMLVIYCLLIYKLCHNMAIIHPAKSPIIITSKREQNMRRNILPVLFLSIFSAISSIPYILLNYYIMFNQYYTPSFRSPFINQNQVLWSIFAMIFILTPIINPLLYNLASSKFREVVSAMICCQNKLVTKSSKRIKSVRLVAVKSSVTNLQSLIEHSVNVPH